MGLLALVRVYLVFGGIFSGTGTWVTRDRIRFLTNQEARNQLAQREASGVRTSPMQDFITGKKKLGRFGLNLRGFVVLTEVFR